MKKRVITLLVCFAYAVILISLLYIQIHYINGELEKKYAVILACMISIPSFALLIAYLRLQIKSDLSQSSKEIENENKITFEVFCNLSIFSVLSKREMEVAWLVYLGYSNQKIGDELFISITTVKKHISHIYEKTGFQGRKDFQSKISNMAIH